MTKHIGAEKFRKAVRLSRSEKRAADTDSWVKKHLSDAREADERKRARLKALREARDATHSTPEGTQIPGHPKA